MSRLTDLIAQARAKDAQMGADLEREFRALSSRLSFGLNFERHRPEAVADIFSDASLRGGLINQLLQATLSTGEEANTSRVEQFVDAFADGFRAARTTTELRTGETSGAAA